jgi:hypothetical protein
MEEKLATRLSKGQISEFVQHDEVHPGQMFGKPALTYGATICVGSALPHLNCYRMLGRCLT